MTNVGLSVILPIYNEEENIEVVVGSTLKELSKRFENYEIILVNDGSSDGSGSIVNTLNKNNRNIKCIHHQRNIGYGAALNSGFKIAQYPWLFFMDSDNQFNISEIGKLLKHIDTFDIVVGFRKVRKD